MTNAVLQATAMSFGERAAYAGRILLIGMGAVFASLIVLWAALALFRRFLERGNDEASTSASPPAPVAPAARSVAPVVSVSIASDDALIAAITAAVAATLAAENGGVVPAFRVVSFQRTQSRRSK